MKGSSWRTRSIGYRSEYGLGRVLRIEDAIALIHIPSGSVSGTPVWESYEFYGIHHGTNTNGIDP